MEKLFNNKKEKTEETSTSLEDLRKDLKKSQLIRCDEESIQILEKKFLENELIFRFYMQYTCDTKDR